MLEGASLAASGGFNKYQHSHKKSIFAISNINTNNKVETSKKQLYLKRASLAGYKSIVDVHIDFKRGLNVIIGKNAAGKTNFLSFLNRLLNFSYTDLYEFSSSLVVELDEEVTFEAKKEINQDQLDEAFIANQTEIKTLIKINGIVMKEDVVVNDKTFLHKHILAPTYISHSTPKVFKLVNSPFGFSTASNGRPVELLSELKNTESPYFIRNILLSYFFSTDTQDQSVLTESNIRNSILNIFESVESIKKAVVRYSPIEDIRINKGFNVFFDNENKTYSVTNLFYEFKVNGNWHPFSDLSDGTKRLFYVISEVSYSDDFATRISKFGVHKNDISRIILLEEPELGVHPHQLMQLMEFLKEESTRKQIIITTHSPQVLNVLERDELDRIIVASSKSYKTGTELRHLTEKEIAKAQKYMEEAYLSDYWQYSNLEE